MALWWSAGALVTVAWMGWAFVDGHDARLATTVNLLITIGAVLDAAWIEWHRPPAHRRGR